MVLHFNKEYRYQLAKLKKAWALFGTGSISVEDKLFAEVLSLFKKAKDGALVWHTQNTAHPSTVFTKFYQELHDPLAHLPLVDGDLQRFRIIWDHVIGGFDRSFGCWPYDYLADYTDPVFSKQMEDDYGIIGLRMGIYYTGEPLGETEITNKD